MIRLNTIKKKSVIQHDSSDCGPACLVSVINSLGGFSTIDKVRRLSGTEQTGTTMLGLYQAAIQSGFDAKGYEATIRDIEEYPGILILHVIREGNLEHYIVDFGFNGKSFVIWDPAEGLKLMTPGEIEEIWKSRKCLGLLPNGSFKYEDTNRIEKKKWFFKILKPDINILIISIILGIMISGLSLVMAVFTQKLIDKILPSKDLKLLIVTLIIVFILLSARILISSLRQLLLLEQGKTFNIRVVDDFFGSLLLLPKPFFDTRKTGDLVGRLNDTIRIQRVITDVATAYIIDILVVIISLVAIFIYSSQVAFFTLVSLPLLFLLVLRWNKKIISAQHSVMSSYAQSESNYIDSIRGIAEIKVFKWQELFRQKNRVIFSDFQDKSFFLGKIKVTLGLFTGIAATAYLILVIIYTSYQVIADSMTSGELLAILSLTSGILPSLLNLALVAIPLSEIKVAMARMFEFSMLPPESQEVNSNTDPVEINRIELIDVTFRFPGRPLLLRNINLLLEKGMVSAIVGESGSGKTTIANILMRFYNPESGKIIVDGQTESGTVSIENWRSKIGIIPQEIHIFNGTILQNIITVISEDKIRNLVSMLDEYGLSTYFNAFPAGLMTLVGEDGLNLSGGQRQIIAFTRALFHKPEFIVIDEGTSNLDTDTEKLLINILMKIKARVGVLLISHKMNLVKKMSDIIHVLENGIVSGSGCHDELLESCELYKKLWFN